MDDPQLALEQGKNGDDELRHIAERCVEQAAERLADSEGDLLCCEREERGERNLRWAQRACQLVQICLCPDWALTIARKAKTKVSVGESPAR